MATTRKDNAGRQNLVQKPLQKAATTKAPKATVKKKASTASKKSSTPKMVTGRKTGSAKKSLAKAPVKKSGASGRRNYSPALEQLNKFNSVASGYRKARPTRYRSQNVPRAKIVQVEGRHIAPNLRYKTGWWRPNRESWMTDETWDFIKTLHRATAKMQKKIYGKEGPGHAGYGSGELQKWTDYILHMNKGIDPHHVDLLHWFAGAASLLDKHFGDRNFEKLMKEANNDPEHMMRYLAQKLQDRMPEMRKFSKKNIMEIVKHKHYTISYGPDGRAK